MRLNLAAGHAEFSLLVAGNETAAYVSITRWGSLAYFLLGNAARSRHGGYMRLFPIVLLAEAKLKNAGVNSVDELLDKGATPKGREDLAAKSRIPGTQILKFVNYADLFRIKGVAGQLLQAAGVDTVSELAKRNASNLQVKLREVNDAKKLTGKVPSERQVAAWIEAAKSLPKKVTY